MSGSFGTLAGMENEPQRRRVRRAKQSRPVAPGFASHPPEAERQSAPSPEVVDTVDPAAEMQVDSPIVADDVPPALPVDDEVWDSEAIPDSSRDGAWLPAGITVLVMVSLLVCAGLVLIAGRQ